MSTTSEMNLEILSPEKRLYKGQASSILLPGKLGYMQILSGHAALIAELDIGFLEFTATGNEPHRYFVAGGFVEVKDHDVRVLVDVIEKPSEINAERAKKSEMRAHQRLSAKSKEEVDYVRAMAALKRANMRITLAKG